MNEKDVVLEDATSELTANQADAEPDPQHVESTLAELRHALAAAVHEIDIHNSEYKYVTKKDKLDHWRRLAVGDVAADAVARPDAVE